MTQQLQRVETGEVAQREPTVGEMMQTVIQGGITADSVAVMEKLVSLKERMDAKQAEREFNAAFAKMQREIPKVRADKTVTDRGGAVMYRYCSYEEIHDQAQPILNANGFSVRFSQTIRDNGKVTVTCFLMHEGGHTVQSEYTARPGKGPPGTNETKEDQSASTIAQKEAFCDALNIIRRGRDNDAKLDGAFISPEQVKWLRDGVKATGSDEARFLAFAQARTYEEIHESMYQTLRDFLEKKANKK